jgi:hypothetical protein
MVVLETRLGLLHQPRSSADGSADAGRLERSRCGGGRFRVRLNQRLRLPG